MFICEPFPFFVLRHDKEIFQEFMELDDVLVPIMANRERGALVAVHQPSTVEDVTTVTICTYEEIQ